MKVALLVTMDTKKFEVDYLLGLLERSKIDYQIFDISLSTFEHPDGRKQKIKSMEMMVKQVKKKIFNSLEEDFHCYAGLGGGTGSQMIAEVFSVLPLRMPKVLLSPFPNDFRFFIADNNIVLIPSLCDLVGLGPTVKSSLINMVQVIKGMGEDLFSREKKSINVDQKEGSTIAVTSLGVTEQGIQSTCRLLSREKIPFSVIHANGFGGRFLVALAKAKQITGVIDYTLHELVLKMYGVGYDIPDSRFSCLAERNIPQVVLPGAVNFHTKGKHSYLNFKESGRKQFVHSPLITHVGLSDQEMKTVGEKLAQFYSEKEAPVTFIFPMQGFSSEDSPGKALENEKGRWMMLEAFQAKVRKEVKMIVMEKNHINDFTCAQRAVTELQKLLV